MELRLFLLRRGHCLDRLFLGMKEEAGNWNCCSWNEDPLLGHPDRSQQVRRKEPVSSPACLPVSLFQLGTAVFTGSC